MIIYEFLEFTDMQYCTRFRDTKVNFDYFLLIFELYKLTNHRVFYIKINVHEE